MVSEIKKADRVNRNNKPATTPFTSEASLPRIDNLGIAYFKKAISTGSYVINSRNIATQLLNEIRKYHV